MAVLSRFFKTKDQIYQILPDTFDDGWTFNFVLNKSSLNNDNITLMISTLIIKEFSSIWVHDVRIMVEILYDTSQI